MIYFFHNNFLRHILFMIVLILLISSGLTFPTYANNYYVDRNANGDGNGTSWANAATSVHALPWGSITDGDTVYISGGSDSTVYPKDIINSKVYTGAGVVVTKAWEAGHNGRVIFKQSSPVSSGHYSFMLKSCQGIRLEGLEFGTNVSGEDGGNVLDITGSYNTVENCKITSNGTADGVMLRGDHQRLNNNTIIVFHNTNSYDQDNITVYSSSGGHTITNNVILNYGTPSSSPSVDLIQYNPGVGSASNYESVIANNFMLYDYPYATNASHSIYIGNVYTNRILIYNNIILTNGTSGMPAINGNASSSSYHLSLRIYNNTIINGGPGDICLYIGYTDTLDVKNNIMVSDSGNSNMRMLGFYAQNVTNKNWVEFDYNRYYIPGHSVKVYNPSGTNYTFSQWQGLGFDTHTQDASVTFANKWGTNISDYTPNIYDTGTNLNSWFTTDILGNTRSGIWDVGAIEQ